MNDIYRSAKSEFIIDFIGIGAPKTAVLGSMKLSERALTLTKVFAKRLRILVQL